MQRLPSAPRLNLGAARRRADDGGAAGARRPAGAWLRAVRHVIERTEDVGERFAEEARRIHYGEVPQRGIRGQASRDEAEALQRRGHRGDGAAGAGRRLKGPVQ